MLTRLSLLERVPELEVQRELHLRFDDRGVDHRVEPVAVEDIDAVFAGLRDQRAQVIGEMQYGDTYRLACLRGPEGIIVALAEQLV